MDLRDSEVRWRRILRSNAQNGNRLDEPFLCGNG
jgi:hypothetical protein